MSSFIKILGFSCLAVFLIWSIMNLVGFFILKILPVALIIALIIFLYKEFIS